jgi:hypothetical protein
MRAALAIALLTVAATAPEAAGAQGTRIDPDLDLTSVTPATHDGSVWRPTPWIQAAGPTGPSLAPPLLSLVLPGAGQHVLGQRRKWAYLAAEAAAWAFHLERRAAGRRYRDGYRDLAWEQARLPNGARVDGDFGYYETLRKWERSGAFDADPGLVGVQPELDPTTFNGSIWALAARIFLQGGVSVPEADPAYQAALAYYHERAYHAAMLWDWSAAPMARAEFGRLIDASDDRFRTATALLGVVLANHLLSAGDAFLAARGRPGRAQLRLVPIGSAAVAAVLVVGVGR